MRRRLFAGLSALVLVCAGARLDGQQPGPERIAGKVVSAKDGRPIAGAMVILSSVKTNSLVSTVAAGEDGGFRFDPVPAGKYQVFAMAQGYSPAFYLQHDNFYSGVVTGAGLETGTLVMALTPGGTISGHVLDGNGEPVAQAMVQLYRKQPDAREPVSRGETRPSDEDGAFEMGDLQPGEYFLGVTAREPWYAVHPAPEGGAGGGGMYRTAVDPGLDVVYPITFYPDLSSSDAAAAIGVKAGEQVRADVHLAPEHAVSITVQFPPGGAMVSRNYSLRQEVFGVEEQVSSLGIASNNGQLVMTGLAPGRYTLEEMGQGGRVIHSEAVDLTGNSVTLAATAENTVTVKVRVQSGAGMKLPDNLEVDLRPAKVVGWSPGQAVVKGAVEFPSVSAGDYRLTVASKGEPLRFSGVSVDGRVVEGARVHISAAADVSIVATIGGEPTKVNGTVLRDGKPDAGSMVVLVPAERGSGAELFRRDETNLDGSFSLENVEPGRYIVVAIDDGWTLRWNDPAVLMPYLLHGVPVEVPTGGTADVNVKAPVQAQRR